MLVSWIEMIKRAKASTFKKQLINKSKIEFANKNLQLKVTNNISLAISNNEHVVKWAVPAHHRD